ncbi:MAG: hypothetical protein JJE17_10340 [Peptostreptococcaceae bacterium]|nr:hypothetical protein [Peptostreptococcaceae bacterium]
MITEREITKLIIEHVQDMNGLFEIDRIIAESNFIAGIIAVLKLQESKDFRFTNLEI